MKLKKEFILLASILLISLSCSNEDLESNALKIYTYSGMVKILEENSTLLTQFSEENNTKVELFFDSNFFEFLGKLEKEKAYTDIVLGINSTHIYDTGEKDIAYRESEDLEYINAIDSKLIKNIDFQIEPYYPFVPISYSFITINYRKDKNLQLPLKLDDLMQEEYKNKVILLDPRNSHTGSIFYIYTKLASNSYKDFWKKMNENALMITAKWSTAYSAFMNNEADFVLSYITSPIYSNKNGALSSSLIFDGKAPLYVDYAMIYKNSNKKELAKKFILFLLEREVQKLMLEENFAYPTIKEGIVNEEFKAIDQPQPFEMKVEDFKDINSQLKEWEDLILKR